jgi:hypothetical protein
MSIGRPGLADQLIGPGAAMLIGISVLIGSALAREAVPLWVTRLAALLTLSGAAWEIAIVRSHLHAGRRFHQRSR